MVSWFQAANLDVELLPPAASPLHAFRFASDLRRTYSSGGVDFALSVRDSLESDKVLVRDVVCDYTLGGRARSTKMGELIYTKPRLKGNAYVWGSQRWQHRISAAAAPPGSEHRAQVESLVEEFSSGYVAHDRAVPVDAIRRAFYVLLGRCDAVLMRQAGGIYFVAHAHQRTVEGMRLVTEMLGRPSTFATVPVPDTPEQQTTVDLALTAEMQRLSRRVASSDEALALLDRLARHQQALPASDLTAAAEVVERLLDTTKSD